MNQKMVLKKLNIMVIVLVILGQMVAQKMRKDKNILINFKMHDINQRIGLISITAGSNGITLTQANIVLFAELYWNPSVLIQAQDRIHRIEQNG